MKNISIIHLPYNGDNLAFLRSITDRIGHQNLYRASELTELWRVIKYGTDRGGFPGEKKWSWRGVPTSIKYEDVIYATTETDIIVAHGDPTKSSSFKKFTIIPDPVVLVYEKSGFVNVADREWEFVEKDNKLAYLTHIIILC